MPGSSTAYLPTTQQFGSDEFDRSSVSFVIQQMFRFRQQATLMPFGPALTCTLDRQALLHIADHETRRPRSSFP